MAAKNKQSKSKHLREIFYRKGNPVTQVSAPSVYGAKMLEKAGYEYAFLGGDATFGTMLGIPGTYMSLTEKTFIGRYFVRSVDIPVVMDCDEVCGRGPAFMRLRSRIHQYRSRGYGHRRQGPARGAGAGSGRTRALYRLGGNSHRRHGREH